MNAINVHILILSPYPTSHLLSFTLPPRNPQNLTSTSGMYSPRNSLDRREKSLRSTSGQSVAKSEPATTKSGTYISIKDSSSTRVKSSTNGEPSVKNKLSVKSKFSIKGKLTIKRKHSFKDKPSKDTEEESMAEEDTSQSSLDDDAPTRSPLPTRSCSRNSRLTGLAYDLDDTHDTKAPNGFLNSAAVNRIDDSDYVQPQRFTLSPEERLHKIIQGASMHDGRKLTSGTDPFTKRVVDVLDPHPHQCLVTRQLDTEIEVEYCHFLPQCDSKDNDFVSYLFFHLS